MAVGYKGGFGTNTCPTYFAGYAFGTGLLLGSDIFNQGSEAAYDINASGRIIGSADVAGAIGYVTWPDSMSLAEPLPRPPGNPPPNAINDAGVIVGGRALSGAVLWRPTPSGFAVEALPIPYPGGACHEATGIRDSGWIVGNCTPAGGERVGVAWQLNGASVEFVGSLVPLEGDTRSNALAVNDSGLATGSSGVGPETAVIWQIGETASSVPALGPVWSLVAALLAAGIARLRLDAPAWTASLGPALGLSGGPLEQSASGRTHPGTRVEVSAGGAGDRFD